jgi:hypothetical protein
VSGNGLSSCETSQLTGVGDQDLGVLNPLGAVDTNLLVQDEACEMLWIKSSISQKLLKPNTASQSLRTLIQVTIRQLSSNLFNDLDVIQIGASLQPQHGVYGEVGKVFLVLSEDL